MISFERLAEALGAVRTLCPDLPVLGIRWLQLKHPLLGVQEALLRGEGWADGGGGKRPASEIAAATAKCGIHALRASARLLRLHRATREAAAALARQPFDLVAKTCCFGPARPADGRDFYFGDLQRRLAERGVRAVLLCGDVLHGSWTAFARGHTTASPTARLAELALLHPAAPIRMLRRQLAASRRLRRLAATTSDPLVRRVGLLAARDCLGPDAAMSALGFWIGRAAVRTWHPRAFLTLYEGHAWEDCMRWGVKSADASCRTIGYQHTVVFRYSLSLMSPGADVGARSLPDVVLCLGRIPMELLRAGHDPRRVRLVRFGSFRYEDATADGVADPRRRTILVTPQGNVTEVRALFEFAHACARQLPAYTFVLRCHPELPIERALRLVQGDIARLPNVVLSTNPRIDEDFARASILLYQGSSAVIYAILRGLFPIHLHASSHDRDPLYRLDAWRARCTSPGELADLLEGHERTAPERRVAEWRRAVDWVGAYTEPISAERIDELVDAVGLTKRGGDSRRPDDSAVGSRPSSAGRAGG